MNNDAAALTLASFKRSHLVQLAFAMVLTGNYFGFQLTAINLKEEDRHLVRGNLGTD